MQPVCPVLVTGMLRSADLSYRCRSVPYQVPKTGTYALNQKLFVDVFQALDIGEAMQRRGIVCGY
jgi:hypothetical protein